ncbi:Glycosyltransferase [Leptospira biflexa serovar Patoc strain 'Patoc 1 (Ames)']|uniref:Putative glycosyltransferase n=1 Tax=Leptospira biflexa serovar Patoc (strain Patoc 1 / ATCC 23582 / Paris) TaxID=456481 RepID=B0SSP4_LEPBP|nr:glycosyl transferase [Leptospira biflexa]ABZ94479.1 Glycosyltransferase [Leptospira biflexa serovar Patoc strain 'Patoc 1 (Ames)']ABZ98134.1 Putative glycosyltransferase [Leptospira biflexa serovar Patoc strain 'Patoc 1 (Paris)']
MILIFSEALLTTGLGHLGRCTALAEILLEKGNVDVRIVLHTDESFPDWFYPCLIYKENWKDLNNLRSLLDSFLIKEASKGLVIYIDSYLAPFSIYEELKKQSDELICIDDNNRIPYPIGSTILNPGYPGLFIEYDKSKYKVLTGKKEVLLRKPFRDEFVIPKRNIPLLKVLITLGGADPNLYSEAFLNILCKEFPELEKHLIIGPGFSNEKNLASLSDSKTFFYKNLSALEMRDLMLTMDFAITAGGQTTYELDRCGVPMVMIKTFENQLGNIRGFFECQGIPEITQPVEIIGIIHNLLTTQNR